MSNKIMWETHELMCNYNLRVDKSYYISYMPGNKPGMVKSALPGLSKFWELDKEETALCIHNGNNVEFFILDGDYRKEYESAIVGSSDNGLRACALVYQKYAKTNDSDWTNGDIDETKKRLLIEKLAGLGVSNK